MRILLVTHDYLPVNRAGVEIYTSLVARELKTRGMEVWIFTTEKELSLEDGTLVEKEVNGIKVVQMTRNRFFREFRDTYLFRPAEDAFHGILEDFRPHLVHFQHLLYLSVTLPAIARKKGIPTLMTLHDFWLQCFLMGQRLTPWGEICFYPDEKACAGCLSGTRLEGGGFLKRFGSSLLVLLRRYSGIDLWPFARNLALKFKSLKKTGTGNDSGAPLKVPMENEELFGKRRRAVEENVFRPMDLFLSPSRFLLEEFTRWGLPRDKIVHLPLGIEDMEVEKTKGGDKIRFGYTGTLAPHKGVHVLLEAFDGLGKRAELHIHGKAYNASYGKKVRELCARSGAVWEGPYEPGDLGRILGNIDCLVVPSLWFENYPLTIVQAMKAGVFVIASDLGGMAELVKEGTGFRFKPGDAGDLRAAMERIIEDPSLLEAGKGGPDLPSLPEHVEELLSIYEGLLEKKEDRN